MAKQIKHTAADKTMSLRELAAFVQDALGSGADGTEKVKARVAFSGKIKDISTDITTPQQTNSDITDAPCGG